MVQPDGVRLVTYSAFPTQFGAEILAQGVDAGQSLGELAKRDGWAALYDPSNLATVEFTFEGNVWKIHDSLGNYPPLQVTAAKAVKLHRNVFGQAAAVDGPMFVNLPAELLQPASIMMLARDTGKTSAVARNLIGSGTTAKRFEMRLGTAGNVIIGAAGQTRAGSKDDYMPGDHVWEGYWESTNSTISIDGALAHRGLPVAATAGTTQLNVGCIYVSAGEAVNAWGGMWGAIAIRTGNNDTNRAEINRMRTRMMSIAGIQPAKPWLWPEIRAFSMTEDGRETVTVGDPDQILNGGVASISKLLTAILARETITDAMLDTVVEVLPEDEFLTGNPPGLVRGDKASYRVLLQSMLIPSNNVAPRTIARLVGATYPGGGTGMERFLARAQQRLKDWGMDWATIRNNPGGGGAMSMRQIAQLLARALADPVLAAMCGTKRVNVSITGPNARTVEIVNSFITRQVYGEIPEWVASKDGTGNNDAGSVFIWNHPDGTRRITVMQSQRLGAPGRGASFINNMIIEADKNGGWLSPETPAAAFFASGSPRVEPPVEWQ